MTGRSAPTGAVPIVQSRSATEWEALGVVCPACRGRLEDTQPSVMGCARCGATYPVTGGIPDLRTLGDPYLSVADDLAAAEALAGRDDGRTFAALYTSYYEGNTKVPPEQVARFTQGVLAATDRAGATVDTWREMGATMPADGLVLDLGCGTAPLGTRLAIAGHRVLGLDAGLRWLVLARKRAAERGVDLPVVCANAEALPLRDARVAAVVGESVLENTTDAVAAISSCYRVIARGGILALTTPNRHSLGPDPHLGLLAGGWRSDDSLRAHARRTGQVMPLRRLFSPGELDTLLRAGGFRHVRMSLPRFADAQRRGLPLMPNLAITGYHLARRMPLVNALVLQVAPTIAVVARST